MKLQGEFVLRDIAGEIVVVPVGKTALDFKGMIILNSVSKVIWECLEKGSSQEKILKTVLEQFDVSEEEASADILEFLEQMRSVHLLNENE